MILERKKSWCRHEFPIWNNYKIILKKILLHVFKARVDTKQPADLYDFHFESVLQSLI